MPERLKEQTASTLSHISIKKPHFLVSVLPGLWRDERIGEVYAERTDIGIEKGERVEGGRL